LLAAGGQENEGNRQDCIKLPAGVKD
jgi:hypothetical protein